VPDRLLTIAFITGLVVGTAAILWREGREPQPRREPAATHRTSGLIGSIRPAPGSVDRP